MLRRPRPTNYALRNAKHAGALGRAVISSGDQQAAEVADVTEFFTLSSTISLGN
jgi:hypothetical protein